MEESLQAQIETHLSHLDALIRRGRQLRDTLATGSSNASAVAATRAWQEDCGVAVSQLSGGSKGHWLARAFSEAFLVRSTAGSALEAVAPDEIVNRLLGVLEQAVASLSQMENGRDLNGSSPVSLEATASRRFEFVHNTELRPVVEQAFAESRCALEQGHFDQALRTTCGILEAIVTDALEQKGLTALAVSGAPAGKIADWSFDDRLAVAEKVGLIRGGCARLPAAARTYRDQREHGPTVSEHDARLAGQVLRVVMRDLDPGR